MIYRLIAIRFSNSPQEHNYDSRDCIQKWGVEIDTPIDDMADVNLPMYSMVIPSNDTFSLPVIWLLCFYSYKALPRLLRVSN